MTFWISCFSSQVDRIHSHASTSWLDLVSLFSEPRRSLCTRKTCAGGACPYKLGSCWSPAVYYTGTPRQNKFVEAITLLVFDIDNATDDQIDEMRSGISELQYFLPSCPSDASYFIQVNDGGLLDVDAVMGNGSVGDLPDDARAEHQPFARRPRDPRSLNGGDTISGAGGDDQRDPGARCDQRVDQEDQQVWRAARQRLKAADLAENMIVDQPPPVVTDRRPTWEIVIAHVAQLQHDGAHAALCVEEDVFPLVLTDMRERDALGRERYGTPLTSGNGRDHLIDAYQELLDGCVYLMNELVEWGAELTSKPTEEKVPDQVERWHVHDVRKLCLWQIRSAIQLRALIKSRAERGAIYRRGQALLAGRSASSDVGTSEDGGASIDGGTTKEVFVEPQRGVRSTL